MKAFGALIVSFFVNLLFKLLGTDAVKEEVNETSGDAKPLDADEYDGMYGVRNRSKGKEGDAVRKSDPDP